MTKEEARLHWNELMEAWIVINKDLWRRSHHSSMDSDVHMQALNRRRLELLQEFKTVETILNTPAP